MAILLYLQLTMYAIIVTSYSMLFEYCLSCKCDCKGLLLSCNLYITMKGTSLRNSLMLQLTVGP